MFTSTYGCLRLIYPMGIGIEWDELNGIGFNPSIFIQIEVDTD